MKTHVDKHVKQLLEEVGTKSLSWNLAGSSRRSVNGIVALTAEVSSGPGWSEEAGSDAGGPQPRLPGGSAARRRE